MSYQEQEFIFVESARCVSIAEGRHSESVCPRKCSNPLKASRRVRLTKISTGGICEHGSVARPWEPKLPYKVLKVPGLDLRKS